MADLIPVLSRLLGYWGSLVVGSIYDRDHQGFQQNIATEHNQSS